ncbi:MAG: sigma 54-interacting transcriptional regulator, partial [candidate division Zixibacteria bacterium]|nr:sigma 54-interacting transcriptional regulator [candidate division Zixibacteria bacterium]
GTVFFDEIGDLPLSTQVKLLRLLQQREYEPVGGTTPVKTDIRIVTATNRDLKQQVAQGRFREDLYFRLAVVKFELPPLKQRREDIPYLVDHFIRRFNARKGRKIISVSPEVMNILMRHEFPGNIRELENIIEYGFVVCKESIIQKEHLPAELIRTDLEPSPVTQPDYTPIAQKIDEHTRLISALKQSGGNITEAALLMGIHRTTLWRKLKRYHIDAKSLI